MHFDLKPIQSNYSKYKYAEKYMIIETKLMNGSKVIQKYFQNVFACV